jgi:DNA repair protein RecO (recombination protein O)
MMNTLLNSWVMVSERRHSASTAFVLHSIPWRETSQIVELFSAEHGRIPLVAKGARRPRSALRGLLQPFQPLRVTWFGAGELRTLKQAEWQGGVPLLKGSALFCGFYLNELLLRLLVRDDPHQNLFELYQQALVQLATHAPFEPVLRAFEVNLLRELGYALQLTHEADGRCPIDPEAHYTYAVELGPVRLTQQVAQSSNTVQFIGKTLLDMARGHYENISTLNQSKQLMRVLLGHYLGGQDLHSRRIIQELPLL